jgi:hypothetical protein
MTKFIFGFISTINVFGERNKIIREEPPYEGIPHWFTKHFFMLDFYF